MDAPMTSANQPSNSVFITDALERVGEMPRERASRRRLEHGRDRKFFSAPATKVAVVSA